MNLRLYLEYSSFRKGFWKSLQDTSSQCDTGDLGSRAAGACLRRQSWGFPPLTVITPDTIASSSYREGRDDRFLADANQLDVA